MNDVTVWNRIARIVGCHLGQALLVEETIVSELEISIYL